MPYKLTLQDARDSLALKSISGLCSGSEEFTAILNEAMRRLDRRGSFFDSEQLVRLCVYSGCITWPRYVGTVLGIRPCNCGPMEIRNNWYSIMGPSTCAFRCTHTMHDAGTAPAYNEITGETGKYLRAYITKLEDAGRKMTFFGIDPGNQPLQEKINGVWQQGITLTLQAPYIQSSQLVQRITSVTRETTQANVLVYEYEPAAPNSMTDLALYEPGETNPRYRRSIIKNFCSLPSSCPETDGVRYRTIEALVKLQFIEVLNDRDFLPLDNLDAIKLAIQAIRLEEANQDDAAEIKWVKAIREMNFEDRNKMPGQQTVVRVHATPCMSNPI